MCCFQLFIQALLFFPLSFYFILLDEDYICCFQLFILALLSFLSLSLFLFFFLFCLWYYHELIIIIYYVIIIIYYLTIIIHHGNHSCLFYNYHLKKRRFLPVHFLCACRQEFAVTSFSQRNAYSIQLNRSSGFWFEIYLSLV